MVSVKNKKRGFSLLELILAIAIFSLSSFAMATLLIDSSLSTQLSLDRTEALLYAKEGIEATRSIRDTDWLSLTDGNHGLDSTGSAWTFSGNSDLIDGKFNRTVGITTVSTSTKDIFITIQWAPTPAGTSTVVLRTFLTNWIHAVN